jgi:hypothetical protein
MTLQGTLDTVGFEDLLRTLSTTTKTGCLRIDGDGGRGNIWVRDGAVAAAATDRVPGAPLDEVVCDLLRYQIGSFTFEAEEPPPTHDVHESVDDLLDRANALLAEWHDLEATVPSLAHRVRLADALPGRQAIVTAEQWPALVSVGNGCTVGDLATALGLTELCVLRVVHDLVTSGLTTVGAPRPNKPPATLTTSRLA